MNRKRAGVVCMAAGAVLIVSALLLVLYNQQEDIRAGQAADSVLPEMQAAIAEHLETAPPEEHVNPFDEEAVQEAQEMTVTAIKGQDYIGCLSIPALNLELPVISEWSYPRLRIAPCRQFGSAKGDDLVIAGHNYRKHFGNLASLSAGDLISFTDMDGAVSYYRVESVGVISPQSTQVVKDSEWDLVLYTCTYGGQNRVMVGCVRTTEETAKGLLSEFSCG